jgi:carbohydrate diacid regulator
MATGRSAVLHRLPAQPGAGPRALAEVLAADLRRRLAVPVRVGVGGVAASPPELRDSYEDAVAALRIGPRTHPDAAVHAIDDLRVHQLLAAVPHRARSRFVHAFAGELRTRPDWPVLRQTIIT